MVPAFSEAIAAPKFPAARNSAPNFRLPEIRARRPGPRREGPSGSRGFAGGGPRRKPGEARVSPGEDAEKLGLSPGETPGTRGFAGGKPRETMVWPGGEDGGRAGAPARRSRPRPLGPHARPPSPARNVALPRRAPVPALQQNVAARTACCAIVCRPRTSCCRPPRGMWRPAQNVATGGTDAAGIRAGPS